MKMKKTISKPIKEKVQPAKPKVSSREKDPFTKLKGVAKGKFTTKEIMDITRPW